MIYLTTAPSTLLSYFVVKTALQSTELKEESEYKFIFRPSAGELIELLQEGSPITPTTLVIEYKEKPPKELVQSVDNTSYLSVPSLAPWQTHLEKSWVKSIEISPELFKAPFKLLRVALEPSALDYFWERFKNQPKKVDIELDSILTRYKSSNKKLSIEDLELMFMPHSVPEVFTQYPYKIGTIEGQEILNQLDDQNLWTMFIGSDKRPPFLYNYLVKKNICPELYSYVVDLQLAVRSQKRDLRAAASLFNSWAKIPFNPTEQDLEIWSELIN